MKSFPNASSHFVRRDLLRTAAAAGLAGLLPSLRAGSAHAAGGVPKRLLLWVEGGGVARHEYVFKSASGGPATETDFVFPSQHEPFNAWRSKCVAFENLDMINAMTDKMEAENAHFHCSGHAFSGTYMATPEIPGGITFDQYIARAWNSPSPVTRIPSLNMGLQYDGDKQAASGPGQTVPFDYDTRNVFRRMFPSGMAPASDPAKKAAAAALAARRKSVLDLVAQDLTVLGPKLGKLERMKLEAHASMVRDLEKSLELTPTASCAAPAAPTDSDFNADLRAFRGMIQAAFACDLTRVIFFAARGPNVVPQEWGYTPGAWGTIDDHDLEHKTGYTGELRNHPEAMACVTRRHQLETKHFTDTLALLDKIPESDGGSVLDHTIVLFCPNMGEHTHEVDKMPWTLFTGKSTGIRTGRYLRFPRTNNRGMPHNNLFVSMAQALGVPTEKFGDPNICTGPLPGLLG